MAVAENYSCHLSESTVYFYTLFPTWFKLRTIILIHRKNTHKHKFCGCFYKWCYPFSITSLTKREQEDLKYKKKILTLAREHEKAAEVEKVDRYYMPEDSVVRNVHVNLFKKPNSIPV